LASYLRQLGHSESKRLVTALWAQSLAMTMGADSSDGSEEANGCGGRGGSGAGARASVRASSRAAALPPVRLLDRADYNALWHRAFELLEHYSNALLPPARQVSFLLPVQTPSAGAPSSADSAELGLLSMQLG